MGLARAIAACCAGALTHSARRRNPSVSEVDLSHNMITKDGAAQLANGLKNLSLTSQLRVVKLSFNQIGDAGAAAAAHAVTRAC